MLYDEGRLLSADGGRRTTYICDKNSQAVEKGKNTNKMGRLH